MLFLALLALSACHRADAPTTAGPHRRARVLLARRPGGGERSLNASRLYLALCAPGIALPYSRFIPFLAEHGFDGREFMAQLFGTPIGGFFGLDVIVSSVVLTVFVLIEGSRLRVPRWPPIAATLTVGVSLGLPLFLFLRERGLERSRASERTPG